MVRILRSSTAPFGQALIAAGTLLLVLAPPAQGAMLVVPIGAGKPLHAVIAAGAQPVGAGPVGGSLVVRGSRAELWPAAIRAGAVLIAAQGGCVKFEVRS